MPRTRIFSDPPNYTAERLNNEVLARLTASDIHKGGVGVRAIRPIKAGTQINSHTKPVRMSPYEFVKIAPEVAQILKDRNSYIFFSGSYTIDHPNADQDFEVFANHSNNPNITDNMVALRDIEPGEELTFSYKHCGYRGIQHMKEQGIEVKM